MSNLSVFDFESGEVRLVNKNGGLWSALRDALKVTGAPVCTNAAKVGINQRLDDYCINDTSILETLIIKDGYVYQNPKWTRVMEAVYGHEYTPPAPLLVHESFVMKRIKYIKDADDATSPWNPHHTPLKPADKSKTFSEKAITQIQTLKEYGKKTISLKGYRVYFILGETTNFIKIGTSHRLKTRVRGIQTQSSENTSFLGSIAGDCVLESKIHNDARLKNVKNEWFYADDELIDCIYNSVIPNATP